MTLARRVLAACLAITAILFLAVSEARACRWDLDTLAAEARGLPGIADVIVGKFDRWPPEVYEQRLERVSTQLESEPTRLDLYDDAGVACDKLGRHDEAIEWMSRKCARLDALDEPDTEHEYRFHANLGTFYIHRWLADGADRDAMTDAHTARDHIARAIEINPEAHFGREIVQLKLIEWIIEAPEHEHALERIDNEKAIEGLVGIITLGAAWQSVDVFRELGWQLRRRGDNFLATLAFNRYAELRDAGRSSVNPNIICMLEEFYKSGGPMPGPRIEERDEYEIATYFTAARPAATSATDCATSSSSHASRRADTRTTSPGTRSSGGGPSRRCRGSPTPTHTHGDSS